MIIGPDFVFIAVPRTASHALAYHWLPLYGGVLPPPGESHHRRDVPPEHAHKFTWAVMRNPYQRVASLWRLLQKFTNLQASYLKGVALEDFPDWLRCGRKPCDGIPHGTDHWLPQAEFLAAARIDRAVRYCHLEDDLRRLPFVREWHDVPRVNASEVPMPELTPGFIAGVNRYCAASFKRFGYERIPA